MKKFKNEILPDSNNRHQLTQIEVYDNMNDISMKRKKIELKRRKLVCKCTNILFLIFLRLQKITWNL